MLTRAEKDCLTSVPAGTDGIKMLHAGLLVRLGAWRPQDQWALGSWFYDPLHRGADMRRSENCQLWGAGNSWTLIWRGFPSVIDVQHAMTDPIIGLSGAIADIHDDKSVDLYATDGSVLRLRDFAFAVLERHPFQPVLQDVVRCLFVLSEHIGDSQSSQEDEE